MALARVRFRHIHAGFVNRSFLILVNVSGLTPMGRVFIEYVSVVASRHGTGPLAPIPMAPSPLH